MLIFEVTMLTAIVNTKLVMRDGIIWDGALLYDGDTIVDVGWRRDVVIPEDAEIIDAEGLYTAPGLVDLHNHGCPIRSKCYCCRFSNSTACASY